MIEEIREFLKDAAKGLVEAVGAPQLPPTFEPAPGGDGQNVLVREGYSLQYAAGPKIRARRHTFFDITTFGLFIKRETAAQDQMPDIFVGDNVIAAELQPLSRSTDTLTCSLVTHPRLERWNAHLAKPLSQKTFFRLVTGAKDDFPDQGPRTPTAGEDLALNLRKIEVTKAANFKAELDQNGILRFSGASDKTQLNGTIPSSIMIRVPYFRGVLDANGDEVLYDIEVQIQVDINDDGTPVFTLTTPGGPVVRYQALTDAAEHLRRVLGEEYLVAMGMVGSQEVPAYAGER